MKGRHFVLQIQRHPGIGLIVIGNKFELQMSCFRQSLATVRFWVHSPSKISRRWGVGLKETECLCRFENCVNNLIPLISDQIHHQGVPVVFGLHFTCDSKQGLAQLSDEICRQVKHPPLKANHWWYPTSRITRLASIWRKHSLIIAFQCDLWNKPLYVRYHLIQIQQTDPVFAHATASSNDIWTPRHRRSTNGFIVKLNPWAPFTNIVYNFYPGMDK